MQFLAMAKFHFRNDPSKLEAISCLTSEGEGRGAIAQEAMDLESAWEKVADWAPTEANTFTSFQARRKQCTELDAAFIAAYSTWRTQSEILNQKNPGTPIDWQQNREWASHQGFWCCYPSRIPVLLQCVKGSEPELN
jgi:hypothetical protein